MLRTLADERANGANDVSNGSTDWLEARISLVALPVHAPHAMDVDI